MFIILSFVGLTACTDDTQNGTGEGCLSMKMNIAMPLLGSSLSTAQQSITDALGLPAPVVTAEANTVTGGAVLTWEAEPDADGYEVYRATSKSGEYKKIATAVSARSYEDSSTKAGKTYYYKVKAIGAVSKSADSSYVKLTGKCATPVISVSNDAKGKPYITWEKVSGAKKYTVYRATSETGKYTKQTKFELCMTTSFCLIRYQ